MEYRHAQRSFRKNNKIFFQNTAYSFVIFLLSTSPSFAQNESPSDRAMNFYNSFEKKTLKDNTATVNNPGYFYFEVEPIHKINLSSIDESACTQPFQNTSQSGISRKLNDILLNRKYGLGLGLKIPLSLQVNNKLVGSESNKIELSLLGLSKKGGKKCELLSGYFKTNDKFTTPLVPIIRNLSGAETAGVQQAVVELVPWAARENDDTRVKAFWGGLGLFASLLGPVGVVGKQFFEKNDSEDKANFTVRTQAKGAVESYFQLNSEGDANDFGEGPPAAGRWETKVGPVGLGKTLRGSTYQIYLPVNFRTNNNSMISNIGFDIKLIYRRSKFDEISSAPNLSMEPVSYFSDFLRLKDNISGKEWGKYTETFMHLNSQKVAEKFDAACGPAEIDLRNQGLSNGDIVFMIYAAARTNIDKPELGKISCLFGNRTIFAARETLTEYKVPMPLTHLPTTNNSDWKIVFDAAKDNFKSPTTVTKLLDMLSSTVNMVGAPNILEIKPEHPSQKKWFEGKNIGAEIDRNEIRMEFKRLRSSEVVCQISDVFQPDGTTKPFKLPDGNEGDVRDRALAFVAKTDTSAALVVLGLNGKEFGSDPEIGHVWIGKPANIRDDDTDFKNVLKQMRDNANCNVGLVAALLAPDVAPAPQPQPQPQ